MKSSLDIPDIIDNKRLFLEDAINDHLRGTEEAKFAVGYLFLSGFNEIAANVSHLKSLKLIIGTTTNTRTIEEIAEGVSRREELEEATERQKYQKPTERRAIADAVQTGICRNIGGLEQTEENENMLCSLRDLIASDKVRVKLYTKQRLHAKVYLFRFKSELAEEIGSPGIAIVGSSNLTLSGFRHSTELNVRVRGPPNFKELDSWFEDLWNDSVPFKTEFLSTIEESWALKYVEPYDLYILTLYNLVKSNMEFRSRMLWDWSGMPKLYRFQKEAVQKACVILNRYDGVFICDVVGLGKTFIGAALLSQLGKRAVVICPPRIKNMWDKFGERFKIDIKTVSHGALNKGVFDEDSELWKWRDREVVLIDESHYFRNSDTKRYYEMHPFLAGKKVILVTATPQNTSIWNIYNQIRLFNQEGTNEYRVKGGSLKEFFNLVDAKDAKIQDLLSKILIRRTRNYIKKNYQSSDDEPITFPKRKLETISYNIDETYNNLFDKIEEALRRLTYAKYNLWPYVKEYKKEEQVYKDLKKVTGLLKGLHKVMLFKRLESSIFAFSETIRRLHGIHKRFLEALESGIIPAGEEAQDLIYSEDVNISDMLEELKEVSKKYQVDDFRIEDLKQDLQNDVDIFDDIATFLDRVPESTDKKFDEIVKTLKKHKGEKVLIFSEYADTVNYLHRRLNGEVDNLAFVTAKTKDATTIIRRFAPQANEYELKAGESPIDVVVSTDVFSTGLNLQDCGIVVNYDLHWNPVLLIQRIGRVDRIGTEHDIIRTYNFLPHKKIEDKISLKERVSRRVQEIHDYIGEDEKILDESERLNKEALYAIYDQKDVDTLEEGMEEEEEFNLDEAELLIDRLAREDPRYLNIIKNLQPGTRSCKEGETYKGIVAYFRKGDVDGLYILNKEGEVITDIGRVISELRCPENENQITMTREDKRSLSAGLRKLEAVFKKEYQSRVELESKKDPVINKAIQKLAHFRKEMKNDEDLALIDEISKVLNRGIPDEALKNLRKLERAKVMGNEYLKGLVEIYNQYRMGDLKSMEREEQEYKPVELVCCEVLK
ncbi:MAG: helicase-related protein [Halobacteriota archaeon]